MTDTLIGDADGIYHPSLFNDRLLLGLKGTMSEAELHVLRARLDGGIRNKAARGELRRGLPVGFVWGEADGEILRAPETPQSAAPSARCSIASPSSARPVGCGCGFAAKACRFPLQTHARTPMRWVAPTYTTIHDVLTQSRLCWRLRLRQDAHSSASSMRQALIRKRIRMLPRSAVGCAHPRASRGLYRLAYLRGQPAAPGHEHAPATPPAGRRGERRRRAAARPGHVRPLRTQVAHALPRPAAGARVTTAPSKSVIDGRGVYCLNVGGVQIDEAVAKAFLAALTPAA